MAGENTEALNFKVTPELKAALERYASTNGLSVSATVRVLLGNALKRTKSS